MHEVAEADMAAGIPVFRLFAEAGLVKTNGEARRLVRGGGARLNNDVIQDENKLITQQDMVDGAIKLSAGKKHHVLVKVGASA